MSIGERIKKVSRLLNNSIAWYADYWYVTIWLFHGFLIRYNPDNKYSLANDANGKQITIVLIPGIYENWQFMKPVADVLHKNGYTVTVVRDLGYNIGDIKDMAKVVLDHIKTATNGPVVLVSHSKGGLIGKYLLGLDANKRIKGLIALNAPFSGSSYAKLMPVRGLQIFSPSSQELINLQINKKMNHKIVSIYGLFDPHIPEGSYLQGATNIQLNTRGHFRIMHNSNVHAAITSSISTVTNIK